MCDSGWRCLDTVCAREKVKMAVHHGSVIL